MLVIDRVESSENLWIMSIIFATNNDAELLCWKVFGQVFFIDMILIWNIFFWSG